MKHRVTVLQTFETTTGSIVRHAPHAAPTVGKLTG